MFGQDRTRSQHLDGTVGNGGDGVRITGGASNATMAANTIGADLAGAAALPNGGHGLQVLDATGTTIGGAVSGLGNLISGNDGHGVVVGTAATLTTASGNLVGTDASGSAALPNAGGGIAVLGVDTLIGGATPDERNLVSGNLGNGIEVDGGLAAGTVIRGNWVGVDASGADPLGNAIFGVEVRNGAGTTTVAQNVVTGNSWGVGINSGASGTVLTGNLIGTDPGGSLGIGNAGAGVEIIDASGNTVGVPDAGNLISGNDAWGVLITGVAATGNVVQGNSVGTSADGLSSLPNGLDGVAVDGAPGNTIGGSDTGAGNLISGNGLRGISVVGSRANGNTIQGNRIGVTGGGDAALGNFANGIEIESARNTQIGGASAGAGNTISGNGGAGILVSFSGASGNVVEGNRIGTDDSGAVAIGNGADGISIFSAPANRIGGAAPGAGNLVSGNGVSGIQLSGGGAVGNTVDGNLIGVQADGMSPLGNSSGGVLVTLSATNNRIGATAPNTVAFNGGDGVVVTSGIGNLLTGNSIYGNGALGIDLNADGVNPNDPFDIDGGANRTQNFPELSSAQPGATTQVQGVLASHALESYTVEYFATASCDSSGHGQGQVFLGAEVITTDGNGEAILDIALPAVTPGSVITATATDGAGNTSEFGPCVAMNDGVLIFADGFESGDASTWSASVP